jgi:hypothetical protein
MIEGPTFTMMGTKEWQFKQLIKWQKEQDLEAKIEFRKRMMFLAPLIGWWIASTVHIACNRDRYFDGSKIKKLW